MEQFDATIEPGDHHDTSHTITTFSAKGLLTKSAAKEVKILMHGLLSNNSRIVNLDMSGLDNLDLWGANQLIRTICCILARGQKIYIWCEKLKIRNLLKLLHISELVPVLNVDNRTSAIESVAA